MAHPVYNPLLDEYLSFPKYRYYVFYVLIYVEEIFRKFKYCMYFFNYSYSPPDPLKDPETILTSLLAVGTKA